MTSQEFIVQVKTKNGEQRSRDGRLIRDIPDKELMKKMMERYPGERENIEDVDEYLGEEAPEEPPKTEVQERLDTAKKSLFSRLGDKFKEGKAREEAIDASDDNFASKFLQKAGGGAALLGGIAEEGIKSIPLVGDAYEFGQEKIGEGLKKGVIDPIAETKFMEQAAAGYDAVDRGEAEPGFEQVAPELLRDASAAGEVANLALGAKGAQQVVKAVDTALPQIRQTVTKVADDIKASRLAKKDAEVDEAVGRILQGKPEDVEVGRKALSNIDTKDVKTYEELNERVKENIESLSKKQDAHLEKFPEKYTPETSAKYTRVGDELVTENPVSDALDGLEAAYKMSGEAAKASAIRQLRARFEKEGLSVKELNQLAKEYGIEYKDRAFDKMGNAKAGYNAESFENIRKGVKEVLRERMPDDVSKELDAQISDLYSTRDLTRKMEENVNKLYQKIKNRTLMQKAGGALADVVDLATLGTLRGFVQKLLPSNVGLKTANSLDLERELQKNLAKIEELSKMKEGPEFDNGVKKLLEDSSFKTGEIPETTPVNKKLEDYRSGKPSSQGGYIANPLAKKQVNQPKGNEPVSSSNDNTLLTEAKKYKSAEEFVKSQPTVYHGTSLENANKINSEGFRTGAGKGVSGETSNDFIYATENKVSADRYVSDRLGIKNPTTVSGSFNGKVLVIPGKMADFEAFGEASKKLGVPLGKDSQGSLTMLDMPAIKRAMQEQGYGAISFSDRYANGSKALAILPDQIKTKSQLTDIWKKANKK